MSGAYYILGGVKGGKFFQHSLSVLLKNQGSSAPNVLYFGAACSNESYLRSSFENGLKIVSPDSKFSSLELYTETSPNDLTQEQIADFFEKADLVFFDGGQIKIIQEIFKKFSLTEHIQRAFENGAYIGGLCAGGAYLAEQVVFSEDGMINSQKGAGIIEGTAVSCNMDMPDEYDQRLHHLYNMTCQNAIKNAIGLSDNHGILIRGQNIRCLPSKDFTSSPPFIVSAERRTAAIDFLVT